MARPGVRQGLRMACAPWSEPGACVQAAGGAKRKAKSTRRHAKRRDTGIAATMSLNTLQEGGYFDMTMQARSAGLPGPRPLPRAGQCL